MNRQEVLDRLAELCGIEPEYHDIYGTLHRVSPDTKEAILGSMRFPVTDDEQLRAALAEQEASAWIRSLPPVVVVNEAEGVRIPISIPRAHRNEIHTWRLVEESGRERSGELLPRELEMSVARQVEGTEYERRWLLISDPPPVGYHRFELNGPGPDRSVPTDALLILTPATCYRPEGLSGEGRTWGITAQLYSLRSPRNWGIGDLTDLKTLAETCGEMGADILSLNPLHALFPHNPDHISPYSPSTRLFKNILYLDIEAIPDFPESEEACHRVGSKEFRRRLHRLRGSGLVDYPGVAGAKREILEILFDHFREHHLRSETNWGREFRRFQEREDHALYLHALYEALQEHFHREDARVWGWLVWPVPYRHPATAEVAQFASEHRDRIEFFEYLQWQVDRQLAEAGRRPAETRLGIGLCADLAVGVDPAGSEAWAYQELFALGTAIGAPPDPFNPEGQDWGLPPLVPIRLFQSRYTLFREMIRRNMGHSGSLRIDHILGLMRQFWIPNGRSAHEGAYVRFPLDDLLGIVALESRRNRCLIIGEDLGTVPAGLSERLMARGILSYRIYYFETDDEGNARPIAEYPEQAAVAVSTHDLPTLAGFWMGRDLAIRTELGLFQNEQARNEQVIARALDRSRLLLGLEREGLLPEALRVNAAAVPEMSLDLSIAIHTYLARTPAKVFLVQLTDLIGEIDPVNFPAASGKYPNWRQRHSVPVEDIPNARFVHGLVERIDAERPGGNRGTRGGHESRLPDSP